MFFGLQEVASGHKFSVGFGVKFREFAMDRREYVIRRETEAAKALLAGIRNMIPEEDLSLLLDTLEGETNLLEAIDLALAEIDETEALISGLKEKEGQFTARRRAMEERVRRFRGLIEQAMAVADQERLRRPTATLTLRKLPIDVVVLSEADIPADFFVPQPPPPPKLDKKALKQALEAREAKLSFAASLEDAQERGKALAAIPPIPGATLDNGGVSLQVRRA
jgi:Siphovirus Gp157